MNKAQQHKVSAFSVLLVMAAVSVIGIFLSRSLNIQYLPVTKEHSLKVSYSYPGAEALVVEREVTSILEGVLSGLKDVSKIESVSKNQKGEINISFHKRKKMKAAKLETESAVRNIFPQLPKGLLYPIVESTESSQRLKSSILYSLRGDMPPIAIREYAIDKLLRPLAGLDGTDGVNIYGEEPYKWNIIIDNNLARNYGISPNQIIAAVSKSISTKDIGFISSNGKNLAVRLENSKSENIEDIAVGKVGDRIVNLSDVAHLRLEEGKPNHFFRVNGDNAISIVVNIAEKGNLIQACRNIDKKMSELSKSFPEGMAFTLDYDPSEYVKGELNKIVLRTILCLLFLLAFVYLATRSFTYLAIVITTLTVNILSSFTVYYFLEIPIHIYTMAGFTVSLGIIIDTSIIMIDHYINFKDRKAFTAIIAATATTIGAALAVLLLPQEARLNLGDFISVICINLLISLPVSYFFIPALIYYLPLAKQNYTATIRHRKKVIIWNNQYYKYISAAGKKRYLLIILFLIVFGIPTFLIKNPKQNGTEAKKSSIIADLYFNNRELIDNILGSSFKAFYSSLGRKDFYREPSRPSLTISGSMPSGSNIEIIDNTVRKIEQALAGIPCIESFVTDIPSEDRAFIQINFKKEFENTSATFNAKRDIINLVNNYTGVGWMIYGLDESVYINNNDFSESMSYYIELQGYNLDELNSYADSLKSRLLRNKRILVAQTKSNLYDISSQNRAVVRYDDEKLALNNISPNSYFRSLNNYIFSSHIGNKEIGEDYRDLIISSLQKESFSLWDIKNTPVAVDSSESALSEIGGIRIEKTDLDIYKKNKNYILYVVYNFMGSDNIGDRIQKENIDFMNNKVLPLGYKAVNPANPFAQNANKNYAWLIFLIISIIYIILTMTFESFKTPLAIMLLIPISFIGLFSVFGFTDFAFDRGGFAAFVMLCGLVINAGIYIALCFNDLVKEKKISTKPEGFNNFTRIYIKAFNRKIQPIMMTIVSTVLGLLPFLSEGPGEVFWFDFAIGTISGMLFSVAGLIFYLPVFLLTNK